MSLKTSFWQFLDSLVLFNPLVLHLGFEILADFKVTSFLLENLLDQDLVNVLKVNSMYLALISLELVSRQNSQDVLVFDKDPLFLINIE